MTPTPQRADRARGTRVRVGNAMDRTQAAIVTGVGACLAAHGAHRTTMIDIAAAAGIAKGTLYNHVRTKSEAFALYADAEVARLLDLLGGVPAAGNRPAAGTSESTAVSDGNALAVEGAGLSAAAAVIATHPVAARMRTDEPAALAALLLRAGSVRPRVVEALEDVVGPAAAPTAWRWLLSLLVEPADDAERLAAVALFAARVATS